MNNNSRTKNSFRNMVTSVSSQLLLIALRFVCRTIFIYALGRSYLGINGLFTDIFTLLSLTNLGLDTAMNFKLYKPFAENDTARIRVLMKFYKLAYTVVGCVILLLGLLLIPFLPTLIKDYNSLYALGLNPVVIFCLFLSQSVSSYMFFAYRRAVLYADQKEYIITLANVISQATLITLQCITLVIFKDFVLYTVLTTLFSIVENFILSYIAKKNYRSVFEKTSDHLSFAEIKELFKDLGAIFVLKANNVVLKSASNLILSSFIGIAVVGLYSNYWLIYTTINAIVARCFISIRASMGNLYVKESAEKKYAFFELSNFATFVLYGTAAIGVVIVSDEFLTTWIGADYVLNFPVALLLGIELLFFGIRETLDQLRNVTGAFRQMWFRPILSVIINICASVALVNVWGVSGVILGTLISYVLTNFTIDPIIIHKVSLNKFKPVSRYYKKQFIYLIVLLAVGLVNYIISKNFLTGLGWISVFAHTVICAVSVPLTFWLIFRKTDECKGIISFILRVIKR